MRAAEAILERAGITRATGAADDAQRRVRAELRLMIARLQRELPRDEMIRVLQTLSRDVDDNERAALIELLAAAGDAGERMIIELRRPARDLIQRAVERDEP